MKLIFTKDENDEITVKLQKGTIIEDFSYTEMVMQLLVNKSFDDTDFGNLSSEEQERIEDMLEKIEEIFEEENEDLDQEEE